jgi:hypothetical protein
MQLMLLVGVIAWLYFFSGNKLLLAIPRAGFVVLFGVITLLNYYTLVTCGTGTRFEAEFKTLSYRHRSLLIAMSVAAIILTFGFALFSAYYVHANGQLRP